LNVVPVLHVMIFAQIGGYFANFRVELHIRVFLFAPENRILKENLLTKYLLFLDIKIY